jgi:DNA polymerase III subunits gamma and tau domain III
VLAREGWDPEQLAESFAGEVRQAFLLQVAPEVADAIDADRERLAHWGEQLGLARTVRILETVGRAIREMKSAPEKIVMLEVAMVRLTKPELDHSYESLDERLVRLERGATRAVSEPSTPAPAGLRPIGATVTAPAPVPAPAAAQEQPARAPAPKIESPEPAATAPTAAEGPSAAGALTLGEVRDRFADRVVPRTPRSAQLLLRSARVESLEGLLLTIAVPTEEMRQNTELIAQGLKAALEHEFKMSLTVQWTIDPTLEVAPLPARRAAAKSAAIEEEYIDREDHGVADNVVVVDSVASHLIEEMFPGAEEIS